MLRNFSFLFLSNLTVWCSFTQSNNLPIPQQTQAQNPRSLLLSNFQWSCQLGTNAGRQRSQHLSSPLSPLLPLTSQWRLEAEADTGTHTSHTLHRSSYQLSDSNKDSFLFQSSSPLFSFSAPLAYGGQLIIAGFMVGQNKGQRPSWLIFLGNSLAL